MKRLLAMLLCLLMVLAVFPAAAMAEEEYVTVTLVANGGYFGNSQTWVVDTETAPVGGTSTKNGQGPGAPHHTDKAFLGWYLTADGSGQEVDPWHFSQTYQEDITFFAKWGPLGGKCGDNLSWSYDTATAKLTITGSGKMDSFKWLRQPWSSVMDQIKEVSLPEGLTSISMYAFRSCSKLTSIVIPNSVTTIEDYAFYGSGLTSVTIPSAVSNWAPTAVSGCNHMTSYQVAQGNTQYASVDGVLFSADKKTLIAYPPGKADNTYSVPNGVEIVGDNAFYNCRNLSSVKLPSGVTTIGRDAFRSCSNLSSINIPDTVTVIEMEAFSWCQGLKSIIIPNSVVKIGHYSFASCTGLTSFTIPASVTTIVGSPFAGCTGLTGITVEPGSNSFVAVDGVLFSRDMKTLVAYPAGKQSTSYTVPGGVTEIGQIAFQGSPNLNSVILSDGVKKINFRAFAWCEGLKTVTIPNSVTEITYDAFYDCNALKDVYYQGTEESKTQIDIGSSNDELLNATWHYGGEAPAAPTATATPEPGTTPAPTPTVTPTPTPEPAKTVKVQAKKSVKLQAPKAKGNSYQWYARANRNAAWQSLGKKGAKDKLSVKATAAMDGYQYRCQVKTATGVVTYTDISELYVYEPLKIKKQPKWGKNSVPGSKMPLSVTARGADSYQWVMRPNGSSAWTMIEGATAPSYVVNVQEGMAGYQFACRVSGRAGSAQSKAATVKMVKVKPPKVSKQPAWKKAVKPGDWVTLSIKAQNADTYQWYYRTSSKGAWILFSGETKPALTFQAKAGTNGYQYKCTVKGKGGTVDSKPVTLQVVAP